MKEYKTEFIENAIESGALKFGEFKLKSGRVSPYFFNMGVLSRGSSLAVLGRCYAEAIVESGVKLDMLFGPAYKGIPLVAATSVALVEHHNIDVPYCFNRKEAKSHGEGGSIVGEPLKGNVLIIDDVITAGTAIREAVSIIKDAGADVSGVVVGVDRKERGSGDTSATQEIGMEYSVPIVSIIDIDNILNYLEAKPSMENVASQIKEYRQKYGV